MQTMTMPSGGGGGATLEHICTYAYIFIIVHIYIMNLLIEVLMINLMLRAWSSTRV